MKRLLALGLVLALLLCGCASGGEYVPTGDGLSWDEDYTGPINTRPQEEKDQTLALAYYADITLNPLRCTDYTNRALMTLMYQSLFVVDRQYQVEPMLCGRYSMSEDMRSYTFYVDGKEDGKITDLVTARPEFVLISTEVYGYRKPDRKPIPESFDAVGDTFLVDYVRVFDRKK